MRSINRFMLFLIAPFLGFGLYLAVWNNYVVAAQLSTEGSLAAGILAPWGILLSPAVGAILMSLSTIIVAINAQLLRTKRF